MDASRSRFPHLDHFLNAYMHQDCRLFGDSIEDVVKAYSLDSPESSIENLDRLRSEIIEFINAEGNSIEPDYHKLYPNSVLPSGWGMTVEQRLRTVASEAEAASKQPHS